MPAKPRSPLSSFIIHNSAFTLVELLTVIGIIALLISILLPALSAARAAGNAARCLSNLRQISTGLLLYADANHGSLPPEFDAGTSTFLINGTPTQVTLRWFGSWYGPSQTFYPPAALLAPYWGTADIAGCPSFTEESAAFRTNYGPVAYAYNTLAANMLNDQTVGPPNTGVKLTRIRRPSEKAAVWDSARIWNGALDRSPWGYPTTGNPFAGTPAEPNVHARHRAYANVAYFDGHAAPVTPHYFPSFPNPTGPDPTLARHLHLGYIDSDNDPTTNEHYQLQ